MTVEPPSKFTGKDATIIVLVVLLVVATATLFWQVNKEDLFNESNPSNESNSTSATVPANMTFDQFTDFVAEGAAYYNGTIKFTRTEKGWPLYTLTCSVTR